jgi:hypothetical protein
MIYPHPESLKQSRSGRVSTSTWSHVPLPRERVRASAKSRHSPLPVGVNGVSVFVSSPNGYKSFLM